ncbi:histidine kinase [Hydrogenibacillus schlegelii]|nr:histidine kinase [Hydrogenibacillus schlegelii]
MPLFWALLERAALLLLVVLMALELRPLRPLAAPVTGRRLRALQGLLFGAFGALGTAFGLVTVDGRWSPVPLFLHSPLPPEAYVIDLAPIPVAIGGLLGGPAVGGVAGLVAAGAARLLVGIGAAPLQAADVAAGLVAGGLSVFFGGPRLMVPARAFFVGMLLPIVQVGAVLVARGDAPSAVRWADEAGPPLVGVMGAALAAFSAIILGAQQALWQASARKMRQALSVLEKALRHVAGAEPAAWAEDVARLLQGELGLEGAAVADERRVLASAGRPPAGLQAGSALRHPAAAEALFSRRAVVDGANVFVPVEAGEKAIGLLVLTFGRPEAIGPVEEAIAHGIGSLLSKQLSALEAERYRTLAREAELRALQAQIHPHFLFNTLTMIHALIRRDPERARRAVVDLAHVLRYVLTADDREWATLDAELAFVRAYAEIVHARFSGRIRIEVRVEAGVDPTAIVLPPVVIQPLVENAVRHGLRAKDGGGTVSVRAMPERGGVLVAVEDDGAGFPPKFLAAWKTAGELDPAAAAEAPFAGSADAGGGKKERPLGAAGTGIGLKNVDARLRRRLGPASGLRIENRSEGGAAVRFWLPAERPDFRPPETPAARR